MFDIPILSLADALIQPICAALASTVLLWIVYLVIGD